MRAARCNSRCHCLQQPIIEVTNTCSTRQSTAYLASGAPAKRALQLNVLPLNDAWACRICRLRSRRLGCAQVGCDECQQGIALQREPAAWVAARKGNRRVLAIRGEQSLCNACCSTCRHTEQG